MKRNLECPVCKSKNVRIVKEYSTFSGPAYQCRCVDCNESFELDED